MGSVFSVSKSFRLRAESQSHEDCCFPVSLLLCFSWPSTSLWILLLCTLRVSRIQDSLFHCPLLLPFWGNHDFCEESSLIPLSTTSRQHLYQFQTNLMILTKCLLCVCSMLGIVLETWGYISKWSWQRFLLCWSLNFKRGDRH